MEILSRINKYGKIVRGYRLRRPIATYDILDHGRYGENYLEAHEEPVSYAIEAPLLLPRPTTRATSEPAYVRSLFDLQEQPQEGISRVNEPTGNRSRLRGESILGRFSLRADAGPRSPGSYLTGLYLFRDEQQKKDCLIQSMQLSREMFPKDPPSKKKDHVNVLLYLGMVYLLEHTLSKKVIRADALKKGQAERLGIEPSDIRSFLDTQAKLRKTVNKFFENPTRTTLWLSGI